MPHVSPRDVEHKSEEELDQIEKIIEDPNNLNKFISARYAWEHRDTRIQIRLSIDFINQTGSSYKLIQGKAILPSANNKVEVPCFVACRDWHELQNFSGDEINLVEHFDQLLPKSPGIGLVTCQNGIQNRLEDFEDMCKLIITKLTQEKPLFIGLYNQTVGKKYGILHDLRRLLNEATLNTRSFLPLRQMFATFGDLLSTIRPRLLWTHIAHSEGGLLSKYCLTNTSWGLTTKQKMALKGNLITLLYGAVAPVPDETVKSATNTYSVKDIAFFFAKKYLDKFPRPDLRHQDREFLETARILDRQRSSKEKYFEKTLETLHSVRDAPDNPFYIEKYPHKSTKNGHTVTIVECISKKIPFIEGDHAFDGDTYQDALTKDIEKLRDTWRFAR